MDLTTSYPASVHEKMLGIVQLKRTIDKGQAALAGTLGEYAYDCPMDRHLFAFLGMTGDGLLDAIKRARSDDDIRGYVEPFVRAKSGAEIETFNAEWVRHGPQPGTPGEGSFLELRGAVAPDRTDVTAWADLLDLDEKRPVPKRSAA